MKRLLKKFYYLLKILRFSLKKNYYDVNNSPIFVVACNRSGTTLFNSILAQHPNIRSEEDSKRKEFKFVIKNNHSSSTGYDNFYWEFLFPNSGLYKKKDGFLHANLKWISSIYKDDFFLKRALINEVYKTNLNNQRPLVVHPFNCFRIKLIKKLFPKAKIILNIRNVEDWIPSGLDKWSKPGSFEDSFRNNRKPDIALNWYLQNSIAIYHLQKYFKNNFYIFHHEKLYDENIDNNQIMNDIVKFLDLPNFKFNFENVNVKYKFKKDISFNYETFDLIKKLEEKESKFFETHNN
tara:strand:+ start:692 stop:1570 length:879 start_codon:yes stop_codon:yes gene_type:complete